MQALAYKLSSGKTATFNVYDHNDLISNLDMIPLPVKTYLQQTDLGSIVFFASSYKLYYLLAPVTLADSEISEAIEKIPNDCLNVIYAAPFLHDPKGKQTREEFWGALDKLILKLENCNFVNLSAMDREWRTQHFYPMVYVNDAAEKLLRLKSRIDICERAKYEGEWKSDIRSKYVDINKFKFKGETE